MSRRTLILALTFLLLATALVGGVMWHNATYDSPEVGVMWNKAKAPTVDDLYAVMWHQSIAPPVDIDVAVMWHQSIAPPVDDLYAVMWRNAKVVDA